MRGSGLLLHEAHDDRARRTTMGPGSRPTAVGLKQGTWMHLSYPMQMFCCRFPADRLQARLLRAAPRIKNGVRRATLRFCPEGVGVRLADDGRRSSPGIGRLDISVIPHAQVLLPASGRSPASKAPTGCAQNQKRRAAGDSPLLPGGRRNDRQPAERKQQPAGQSSAATRPSSAHLLYASPDARSCRF
jgi:hypothetical protein